MADLIETPKTPSGEESLDDCEKFWFLFGKYNYFDSVVGLRQELWPDVVCEICCVGFSSA